MIGNVTAGSLFTTAQATVMGTGILVLANTIGEAVTRVVGVAVAVIF